MTRRTIGEERHLLSIEETAVFLGVSSRTLRRYVQRGLVATAASAAGRYMWTAEEAEQAAISRWPDNTPMFPKADLLTHLRQDHLTANHPDWRREEQSAIESFHDTLHRIRVDAP